jgi:NADPH-dependent 2,4-dienoyl-CoA reductase/sulfur reductase-like enzyme
MARKMLADPEIARKLEAGRPETVRPCIYCYTCVAQPFFDRRVRCSVNPITANEIDLAETERTPAPVRRRVVIAGGGTAGLEAARVAALRGHHVTLFEQGDRLGGTLRFAALAYEPNERLLDWLIGQVDRLGVDVRLGESLTVEGVRDLDADEVIVATGARRERPDWPGVTQAHVFDGDDLRALLSGEDASDVSDRLSLVGRIAVRAGRAVGATRSPARLRALSRHYMPIGERVVVIGGGLVGLELAEFFVERDRTVSVLHEGEVLGLEMAHPRRWRVLEDLRRHGATLVKQAVIEEIESDAVRYRVGDARDRAMADTVVITTGLAPNTALADELRAAGIEPIVIGDCTGVGYIEGAIHDGFHAAITIGESTPSD